MSKRDKGSSRNYANEINAFETYNNKYKISFLDFKLILKTFFSILQFELIGSGNVIKLPFSLGTLSIRKKETPKIGGVFDYKLFKETGIKRYIKNDHSSKYLAKYHWDTSYPQFDSTLPNSVFDYFPPRFFKRYLAKEIKDNNAINRYYDL